ncbi:helix-turn-helix transcriptional regulator [Ruminococcus sp.]|nr:helix-turn-helix transcriptional regulator [Ruminococcus sp.]
MDQVKTGALIRKLRIGKGLTQKQPADMINVSGKAVSKLECGVSHI